MATKQELVRVVEGVTDSAASEYWEANLVSAFSIAVYAENALEIALTKDEAEVVLRACRSIMNYDGSEGQNHRDHIINDLLA